MSAARDASTFLASANAPFIEELYGQFASDPASVPEDILLLNTDLVGRYALNFKWTDFHETGIFSFDLLRKMAGLDAS